MQDSVDKTDILAAFSTDHSPILLSFQKDIVHTRGKGLWKFNSSLTENKVYIEKMKQHISDTLKTIEHKNQFDDQMKWEYLKFEIRRFTRSFSKRYAKEQRQEREN